MSTKLQYAKPAITKMGPVADRTEGGLQWVVFELMGKRGGIGG